MGYLRGKLNVKCRTKEEEYIYRKIATKEGFTWSCGDNLLEKSKGASAPCSFQIGYFDNENCVTYSNNIDYEMPADFTTVEASVLFHNELVSRRIKDGRT